MRTRRNHITLGFQTCLLVGIRGKVAICLFRTTLKLHVSKKVCAKGCILNAFASHQESSVLANQGRKPVLGVPIITNKCVSGAIVLIGKSTSTRFTNFDVTMSKYLASLVALLLKPNGNSRHVQTDCKMDQVDKIFRVFNTNEFAKELEKGETMLDLYCCIQNRFECIIHDAQSVLLFFIDSNNKTPIDNV